MLENMDEKSREDLDRKESNAGIASA